MRIARLLVGLLFIVPTGCVRRDGRNSDCKWPGESPVHAVTPRHLSADAEFAEDLAIRYADTHVHSTPSNRDPQQYITARDQCGQSLFEQIAALHNVPIHQVSASLGKNRFYIDAVETLLFLLVYVCACVFAARRLWRRYPPEESGWWPAVALGLLLSLFFAAISTMLIETWCATAESLRVGSGHMSYRMLRLYWAHHRVEFFVIALLVFWVVMAGTKRRGAKLSTGAA